MIFSGKAGGFMAEFAKLLGKIKGMDYVPINLKSQTTFLIGVLRFQENIGKGGSFDRIYYSTWQEHLELLRHGEKL
jgi:hypothetical protein